MWFKTYPEMRKIVEATNWYVPFKNWNEFRRQAKEKIKTVQQKNKRIFEKRKHRRSHYNVGELIAIRRTQVKPGLKFAAKFLGPYEVMRIMRYGRYAVQKIGDHEGLQTVTIIEFMKLWLICSVDKLSDTADIWGQMT